MGIFECIYECGCVDMISSLDNFKSTSELITCSKHEIKIGNTIYCDICNFVHKFKKKNYINKNNTVDDATIINIFEQRCKNGTITIYQLETTFDCSVLDQNKIIYFSDLENAQSWKLLDNGNYLITLPSCLVNLVKNPDDSGKKIYDWNKKILMTKKEYQQKYNQQNFTNEQILS